MCKVSLKTNGRAWHSGYTSSPNTQKDEAGGSKSWRLGGELTHLVKFCLASLRTRVQSQHTGKKLGMVACACNRRTEKVKTGHPVSVPQVPVTLGGGEGWGS